MKTETKIAEENIKKWNSWEGVEKPRLIYGGKCHEHKASCQRFFAFLQALKRGQQRWLTYQLFIINNKTVDLENAIKKYDEAGI